MFGLIRENSVFKKIIFILTLLIKKKKIKIHFKSVLKAILSGFQTLIFF